ncbi:WH2 motif domain containing protein [Acanthamoeba castellanii str. Neff]|uniref:WH2 motif domain containing protein n=1 Tax=Acanthamoeba castellanii (strain ATCC 30010 / Neff) TaxID=1257118 RepID=L8GHP1_ACACF|nr:WH2 motif domain containing protein [Acanthamoeba castellanii str. Neff]ELR12273.1 WH2 motif domain containing protein [Acanthamoeba castellanii str. Neff]
MDANKKENKMNEMKEQLVEGAKKTMDEAKDKFEDTRDKINEEGSALGGYKDKLMGQVKERVGHLFGIDRLEQRGHKQRSKGESVLAQHDAAIASGHKHNKAAKGYSEKRSEAIIETFIQREALMAELERTGGFERYRSHMKKVDLKDDQRDVRDLFKGGEGFKLKQWNKQALLGEIRGRKTMKPLVVVETQEKGLMRSIPLEKKKDFTLRRTDFLDNLWADIKRSDVQRLNKVNDDQRSDRSAPRLELFHHLAAACEKRDSLLKDIQADHRLKHVDTEDKSKPEMFFDKTAIVHRFEKARLLNEVREGAQLKHVATEDKSKPTIDRDTQLKTWDRQGFLDEVRIGTELRHI